VSAEAPQQKALWLDAGANPAWVNCQEAAGDTSMVIEVERSGRGRGIWWSVEGAPSEIQDFAGGAAVGVCRGWPE
jgi:hypothetical protein